MIRVVDDAVIDYAALVIQSACCLVSDTPWQPYDEAVLMRSHGKLVSIWRFACANICLLDSRFLSQHRMVREFWDEVGSRQLGAFSFRVLCDQTLNIDGGIDNCVLTMVPLRTSIQIGYAIGPLMKWKVNYSTAQGIRWEI